MITKIYTGKDNDIHRQLDEIMSHQSKRDKEISVTFTAADTETLADCGFLADRFRIVDNNANITVYRTSSDNRYMHLKASGAGTVIIQVYKKV